MRRTTIENLCDLNVQDAGAITPVDGAEAVEKSDIRRTMDSRRGHAVRCVPYRLRVVRVRTCMILYRLYVYRYIDMKI